MNDSNSHPPFQFSPFVGEVDEPNGCGRAGSVICGAFLRITLRIDEQRRIEEARFKVAGCSRLVSSCATITEAVRGLSTAAAADKVRLFASRGTELLGEVPDGREHCAGLAVAAVLAAISDYSDSARDEWTGDDALICSCFGVSEQTIEVAVREKHLDSIEAVTNACSAGGGCRSCYPLIQDILDCKDGL